MSKLCFNSLSAYKPLVYCHGMHFDGQMGTPTSFVTDVPNVGPNNHDPVYQHI